MSIVSKGLGYTLSSGEELVISPEYLELLFVPEIEEVEINSEITEVNIITEYTTMLSVENEVVEIERKC